MEIANYVDKVRLMASPAARAPFSGEQMAPFNKLIDIVAQSSHIWMSSSADLL